MKSGADNKLREGAGIVAVALVAAVAVAACLTIPAGILYFAVTMALNALYVTYDAVPLLVCCYGAVIVFYYLKSCGR